jgi:hypothetical protein
MSTDLREAIRAATDERDKSKQENQSSGIPESGNTTKPENHIPDEAVNLSIRVSKRQRLHWLIEAKKQGTSLTAVITDALNARFGSPAKD